ncbi:MAG TPA: GDSL-type esterase/lipase family protein [Planctomycetota bacterium]|nr:GDSL-type esterase/lipase family protein [Planctomycetota bacterium]
MDHPPGSSSSSLPFFRSLVVHPLLFLLAASVFATAGEPAAKLDAQYVFTDGAAVVRVDGVEGDVAFGVRVITERGMLPETAGKAAVRDGRIEIKPVAEGIHVVTLELAKPVELRFLAIAPPPKIDKTALSATLPRNGAKLVAGEPYTIVAMGDSVTATGDYEGMLSMLLSRATGNAKISVIDRSYPGRSVDAAVRFFKDDAIPNKPDLGLLMYGLNDQAAGVPLDAYLEQYRWIAEHLASDCGADCVFMQPTPHIAIPQTDADRKPDSPPAWYAFRTIGFAEALRPLAAELKVPVAETFQAIWGSGGVTIEEAAKNMWPKFPPGYNDQMKSMLETGGNGDTIHPNALGHLAMAKAVFDAIAGRTQKPPLELTGTSTWTDAGVVSQVTAENVSAEEQIFTPKAYPLMDSEIKADVQACVLQPGQTMTMDVSWPGLRDPGDRRNWPLNQYLRTGGLRLPVVIYRGDGCRVYAPLLPFDVDVRLDRRRLIVDDGIVEVARTEAGVKKIQKVQIPPASQVGRLEITASTRAEGKVGWDSAEVAYVRFGGALAGEATVDGELAEWAGHGSPSDPASLWSTMGEPCQARWVQGEADNRAQPAECFMKWAFRAGKAGIFLAVKATGDLQKDRFTLFFDTREPKLLGAPGRYYWASGSLKADGTVPLGKGETSKDAPGITGAWKKTDGGSAIEMFVPYELMELTAWPASGDLGLSIWWTHTGPDGKVTQIMWSEDGHPWNTRWYGVVRLVNDAKAKLPYVVRVK